MVILLDDQNNPTDDTQMPAPTADQDVTDTGEGTDNNPEVPGESPATDVPETGEEPEAGEPAGGPMGENPDVQSQDQDNGQPA